jgi:hypothetical protein
MISKMRKKPRNITRLFILLYLSIKNAWIVGSLILSLSAFAMLVARLQFATLPPWLLAGSIVCGLGVATAAVIRGYKELDDVKLTAAPIVASTFEQFLSEVKLPAELQRAGYTVLRGGIAKNIFNRLPYIAASAISTRINSVLWKISEQEIPSFKTTVPKECRSFWIPFRHFKSWRLPTLSRQLLFPALQARTQSVVLNELKIRLREDLYLHSPDEPLVVERTDYLADLVTGQLTGVPFVDAAKRPYYNGYDLPFESKPDGWYLKTCESSACSNQLGVSSLVVAVSNSEHDAEPVLEGNVFIVVQGSRNLQSADLLAPSGSGSLDWSDYEEYGERFIAAGMMRELLEETTKGDWTSLLARGASRILLTGFGRMLHRGGKPEFYGLAVMPRNNQELGIDSTEKHLVSGFESIHVRPLTAETLRTALQTFKIANQQRLSHPLFVCLQFAEDFLRERGAQFDHILQEAGKRWQPKLQCPRLDPSS